jgi:putative ABC transport system permease protein
LLLALAGGALGLLAAQFGVKALIALRPPDLPRLDAISLDRNVFLFALGITTLIGLLVGLIPAVHASRSGLQAGLKESSRQTPGGQQMTRRILVMAEVALALVLLVSAGLLLRSLERLFAVPAGFNPYHVLSMQIDEVGHGYDSDTVRYRFWKQALEAVRHVPGVTQAALTNALPLSGDGDLDRYGMEFEKDHDPNSAEDVMRYAVTTGYFETMDIPLKRGRYLDENDRADAPPVALISESLAKRKLSGVDPLGQRVHIGNPDRWYTIVGVVGDVKQMSLALNQPDAVYTTVDQWQWVETTMSLVVRTPGDAPSLAPAVRSAIWSVDKSLPIDRVDTMDHLVAASAAERQFTLILFEAFGIVALALAAVGIYGVLSFSVNQRTHEIGIRLALGAHPRNVLQLIVRQGMKLVLVGLALGVVASLVLTRFMAALLFDVGATDPLTFATVAALLLLVALAASYIPARRAMSIDPMIALRYE